MKNLKIIILLLIVGYGCHAQEKCESISFGNLLKILKESETRTKSSAFKYLRYQGFSFKSFRPTEGAIDENNFYEIGFDSLGSIREVIHHEKFDRVVSQKMTVHEYSNCRILLYQINDNKAYYYLPIAIVMLKNTGEKSPKNFMINPKPLFGAEDTVYKPGSFYEKFPTGNLADVSVIMTLNDDLFPVDIFKFNKGKIVFESHLYYGSNNIIDYELADLFFSPNRHDDFEITSSTCLSDLLSHSKAPDMTVFLHPRVSNFTKSMPLWIYGGAHEYQK